jgi:hypothetical protein
MNATTPAQKAWGELIAADQEACSALNNTLQIIREWRMRNRRQANA